MDSFLVSYWVSSILDTKNGWIITLVVVLLLIYFGIMITVLFCPVRELALLPGEESDKSFANVDDNDECANEEGNSEDIPIR